MLKGWNSSVRTTSAISSAWMPTLSVSLMLAQVPVSAAFRSRFVS